MADDGSSAGDGSSDDDGPPAGGAESSTGDTESPLSPAVRSSLLWGVVGGLSFLVLVQGYELTADVGVSLGAKFGVALLVAVAAAALTHVTRDRLPAQNESP